MCSARFLKLRGAKNGLVLLQLGQLVAEFDSAIAEKNAVEAEAEKCQRKLDLAQRLMRSLGSEGARWGQTIDDLKEQVSPRVTFAIELGFRIRLQCTRPLCASCRFCERENSYIVYGGYDP